MAAAGGGYRRRQEPALTRDFGKDAGEEDFLEWLNRVIAPEEERAYGDPAEVHPTLHVIGAPRSGTTLLYQVIANGLDIGYVNNLVAAFWLAPATGVRLSRKLGLDGGSASFDSRFGRTPGIEGPHEFGYFWNHRLGYPDLRQRDPAHEATIDWDGLRRAILAMEEARGGPMAFKPMLLTWHLEEMVRHMPRTCYVWIRRDPRDTALSLLKMRASLFGDYAVPSSLQPVEMDPSDPPWRQVAVQVVALERTIEEAARRMGPERVLSIRYERLCADPGGVLGDIRALLGRHGAPPALRSVPEPFTRQRNPDLDERFGDLVAGALAELGVRAGTST
ncbi:MAG: sulfotransferase [Thermoleophilia bacterium]